MSRSALSTSCRQRGDLVPISRICLSDLWKSCVNRWTDWWKIHLLPVSLCRKSMLKATLLALQQGHLPHSPWWMLFGAWGWEPWVRAVYRDRSEGGWGEEMKNNDGGGRWDGQTSAANGLTPNAVICSISLMSRWNDLVIIRQFYCSMFD